MWYRLAEQGLYDPKTSTGESMMKLLRNFVAQSIINETILSDAKCILCKSPGIGRYCEECGGTLVGGTKQKTGKKIIDKNKLMSLIQNSELSPYVKDVILNQTVDFNGEYDFVTKTISIKPKFDSWQQIWQMLTTFQHELNHALSPLSPKRQKIIDSFDKNNFTQEEFEKFKKDFKKFQGNRGRLSYFSDEEIRAQTVNIINSFHKNILTRVYSKYYKKNPKQFIDDYKKFISDLGEYEYVISQIESDKNKPYFQLSNSEKIFADYPEIKDRYLKYLNSNDLQSAYEVWYEGVTKVKFDLIKKYLPSTSFIDKIGEISGLGNELNLKLYNIKDPKFFINLRKQLSAQLPEVEKILNVSVSRGNFKDFSETTKKLEPEIIQKLTVDSPEIKKPVTPQVDTALQKALPIIINTFNKLNEAIQKISNTRTGKVLRVGLITKDVVFIITSSNKILNDIENERELQYKDIYDLGLSVVSLLSDPDTTAIVSKVYPPAALLLRNPEVVKWMTIINVSANTLQALVQASDYLGAKAGTTNPNVSQLSGILNNPGSLQQLSMTASQLKDQYGELYNALIDIEKGMKSNDAFNKHISSKDPLLEYKKVLLNRFLQNRNILKQKQKSSKTETYPSANSSYAISSYKKTRDQQNKMNVPVYNNRLRTMEQI